jgi:hypothetical protein
VLLIVVAQVTTRSSADRWRDADDESATITEGEFPAWFAETPKPATQNDRERNTMMSMPERTRAFHRVCNMWMMSKEQAILLKGSNSDGALYGHADRRNGSLIARVIGVDIVPSKFPKLARAAIKGWDEA